MANITQTSNEHKLRIVSVSHSSYGNGSSTADFCTRVFCHKNSWCPSEFVLKHWWCNLGV
eukprot:214010-Amphidinium_carterae.1